MINRPVVLTVRVTMLEFEGIVRLGRKWNVDRAAVLRALIVDALAEEGDDVRRKQSKGCTRSSEEGKSCGAAT